MKKQFLVGLCALVVSASAAMAGIPAGWDSNPYYTYQTWSFDSESTSGCYSADSGYTNSAGTPNAFVRGDLGWDNGYIVMAGPATSTPGLDTMLTVCIPNVEVPNRQKEIWVNLIFETNNDFGEDFYIVVLDDNNQQAVMGDPVWGYDPMVSPVRWSMEVMFSFDHQPASESLLFGLTNVETGEQLALDSITIATQCVPEPATLALLVLGGLSFIARRK